MKYREEIILQRIKEMLTGRVNELLGEAEFQIPPIEFGVPLGGFSAVPILRLAEYEQSEKERIIRVDAYALTLSLEVPKTPDSERDVYAYGAAISTALAEDPTLGGVADRAVITGKKYVPPKKPYCGDCWELIVTLRVTVEGITV
ncbi:hypothetical protein TREPR_2041 [Treponema primitia ZAS-2]|uniref:Uncharacterized protein n=1 Tax=Treponema primitia (strain ATCC BAA-887 / DSM 12427 / ZAS-2) TaxID=545694 RepID=F5YJU4_TREPZ|nr:hypothetical protein [Treponema primitia]AEF85368.1 hypothetical protein TREPR_2041 [Treponema primitia ZAS-2]